MRELESSLQQFGEFLLKARLARPNAAPYLCQCPWLLQYPQWSHATAGSMTQASETLTSPA